MVEPQFQGVLSAGEAHGNLGGLLRGVGPYRQDPLPGMDEYLAGPPLLDEYEARFREIFDEAMALYRAKTSDYQGSWRSHGLEGVFVRMADKFQRLDALIWRRKTARVKSESVQDTLRDLLPYTLMALVLEEEGNLRG